MIPVLAIPYYNRFELLQRCIASIDHPVETLVIVDNSPNEHSLRTLLVDSLREMPVRFDVIRHPNAGVAASWNEVIKLFPAPWWLLVNNDIEFAPGDLKRMVDAIPHVRNEHGAYYADVPACFYGNHGASWWAVTQWGIKRVGLFDENFYPAYLEDCDWSRRADLLGVKRITIPGMSSIHGDGHIGGSCTVNATADLQRECRRTHAGNFEYYRRKWGGDNEKEVFATPFNDPHWPLWAWRFEPKIRERQQWSL